jgi:threonine/homoserine/homoserine lactone efflux protein
MSLLINLFEILVLGIIGGLVPGPILMSVFAETLNGGLQKGFRVISLALFAESLIAFFILSVAYSIGIPPLFFHLISLGGAMVLFWLAWQVWKIKELESGKGTLFSFPKIFLLTVLNGGFWIFWITVSVPRALDLESFLSGGRFLFLLLFEFGWFLATTLLAILFSYFRPILQKKDLVSFTFKMCAVLLVAFGIQSLYESICFLKSML